MPTIETGNPKVVSWASDNDGAVLAQAARSASLSVVHGHVALMPDAHIGYGATVGSVIPTDGAIIPSAVGVDIGCGMIAAQLPMTSAALGDNLNKLHSAIARVVPAGVGKGHEGNRPMSKHYPRGDAAWYKQFVDTRVINASKLAAKAESQFGTLGSGNHFIEVSLDENDNVWIVLHSGSRGIGKELAEMHIDTAKGEMREQMIKLDDPDLAYLTEGTTSFDNYIKDMFWAQDYALGNRETMMDAVLYQARSILGVYSSPVQRINCHHNYSALEYHNGKALWVTRKGAIKAGVGDLGIIPGSMGTSTFIVEGLGNTLSYESCSHGAGRRMSRGEAKRTLDVESLNKAMEGKVWNNNPKLLDEHPESYKDVNQVMKDQSDLCEVKHTLTQVLNYKGS
jgi:tRNA-splicing ligase RtcB (3'-phosphate/5'-hydroxy nucleic acid ligase)